MAASAVLIILVVSLSNMLVDSLTTALVSKRSEVGASIASDIIENAKALGEAALSTSPAGVTSCTTSSSAATFGTAAAPVPVPARTASNIQQCFTIFVDNYLYEVTPILTAPTSIPATAERIEVDVAWASGTQTMTYSTYGLVGS